MFYLELRPKVQKKMSIKVSIFSSYGHSVQQNGINCTILVEDIMD